MKNDLEFLVKCMTIQKDVAAAELEGFKKIENMEYYKGYLQGTISILEITSQEIQEIINNHEKL